MMDRMTFVGGLATLLTLGFFAFLAALFALAIPEENRDLLTAAAGVLFGGANMAWGFYLGSSEGSKSKDDTIAAAMVAEGKS
jgi:ABC-type transport system involved in cytochrome c biogenesis permease component